MDLVSLLVACSLYPDDRLVLALAHAHTGDNPWFVNDASAIVQVAPPSDRSSALAALAQIHAQHGRALIGILAVPEDAALAHGYPPESLLDPCTNLSVGTSQLASYADDCGAAAHRATGRWPNLVGRRECVVARYARTVNHAAANYPQTLQQAVSLSLSRLGASSLGAHTPERSPIVPDDDNSDWPNERLYVREVGSPASSLPHAQPVPASAAPATSTSPDPSSSPAASPSPAATQASAARPPAPTLPDASSPPGGTWIRAVPAP